jgi:DNA-binding response OmpR family regulator
MSSSILVIEEDPDLGRLFDSMLGLEGYQVTLTHNVTEAREALLAREPDLIVFDWQLSNADGFMWVDRMRSDDRTVHIPILLICGVLPPRSVYEMLGNIGVPVLEKPFDLLVFSRHIKALLRPADRAVGAA